MDLYNATISSQALLTSFSYAEAISVSRTLGVYVLGLALYAIFIFKFYHFLARKDVFKLNLLKYESGAGKFFGALIYVLKYLIIFPIVVFFWFTFLGLLLIFLSDATDAGQVLLIAISLVGAVRICAYYNEDLSKDLAKMLPLALLGIFLVDASYFNVQDSIDMLYTIPSYAGTLAYYFVFIIGLELVLRVLTGIKHRLYSVPGMSGSKDKD